MRKELILAQGYLQAGLPEAALETAHQILSTTPDDADANYICGSALERLGKLEQALPHLRTAVSQRPDDPLIRHALGLALYDRDCLPEALTHLQAALELGGDAHVQETLAACLMSLSCPDLAEPHLVDVTHHRPDDPVVWCNLASALIDLNRCDEAVSACDRALDLDPDYADAHMARSIAQLLAGNWSEAWPEYDWRWRTKAFVDNYPQPNIPRWRGEALPMGGRLWVRGEQGFGDQIQFARYIALAADRANAEIVVSANEALHGLIQQYSCVTQCVGIRQVPDGCSAEIPMQSLPEIFNVIADDVKVPAPYFTAPTAVGALKLPPRIDGRLRVGVCWAGKPRPRDRAIDPAFLVPVFDRLGVDVFSLQVGGSDYPLPIHANWTDMAPVMTDFSATAAVLGQLDALVSIDTGVAHLAGALGVPTALMLIHGADWRWLLNVGWTPWYPNTVLMRQHERGNWSRPVAMVEAILRQIQNSV
jgi:tetratricopeptide (TPR) repeat protein